MTDIITLVIKLIIMAFSAIALFILSAVYYIAIIFFGILLTMYIISNTNAECQPYINLENKPAKCNFIKNFK